MITWFFFYFSNTTGKDQVDYIFADDNLIFNYEYNFYAEKKKIKKYLEFS